MKIYFKTKLSLKREFLLHLVFNNLNNVFQKPAEYGIKAIIYIATQSDGRPDASKDGEIAWKHIEILQKLFTAKILGALVKGKTCLSLSLDRYVGFYIEKTECEAYNQ